MDDKASHALPDHITPSVQDHFINTYTTAYRLECS